jgi:hypothetical protein
MRPLTAATLLSTWERATQRTAVERALLLLAAACPETEVGELARLSIGKRDSLLISLREKIFGPRFVARAPCAKCGESLEVAFNVADIRFESPPQPESLSLDSNGYKIHFRLPNSEDVALASDVDNAEQALLQRCVVHVTKDGVEKASCDLPPGIAATISARMAAADPQAQVEIALSCVACRHKWSLAFDIAHYFWNEINAWANRMLREIHAIASAYGWREEEILALSPRRRQFYVDLIGE